MFVQETFEWTAHKGTSRERVVTFRVVATDEGEQRFKILVFEKGSWRPSRVISLSSLLRQSID